MRIEAFVAVAILATASTRERVAGWDGEAGAANKACELVTAGELEALLGAKVTVDGGGGMPTAGGAEICSARSAPASVMLRLFKRTVDPSGAKENAGIEMAKKMGAQVDVKTFGPITCSSIVPPDTLAGYGFNTTCSVTKAPMFAVIEVNAKAKKDMVAIERLHAIAEKMAGRF